MRSAIGWEFLTVTLPRGTSRSAARAFMVGHAESGQWVLDRVRVYPDGTRRVRLRRRAMRVTVTV
jgi:hypothetical protein